MNHVSGNERATLQVPLGYHHSNTFFSLFVSACLCVTRFELLPHFSGFVLCVQVLFCQCFPSDPPMDALLKCSSWRQGVWLRSDPEEERPCGAADPLLSPRVFTEPHEDMHPSESGVNQHMIMHHIVAFMSAVHQ